MATTSWSQSAGMTSDTDTDNVTDDVTPTNTSYTQRSGMASDTDVDNVEDFIEQAEASKDAAAASAAAAALSETAAETAETNAATSETNAAASAATATTKASEASASAATATTKASEASTSASNAAASATAAQTAQTAAETAKTGAETAQSAAETAETGAETARDAALAALDSFDDRYLGVKTSDPTVDNDGDALVIGAIYFNSNTDLLYVYNGTTWQVTANAASGDLVSTNNLSDLTNPATARTNLGLGTGDSPTFAGINATGNATFGDSDKAIFGAGSDLQIYHDGSNSYIKEAGQGALVLQGTHMYLKSTADEYYLKNTADGSVEVYHNGSLKLATTSTGVDVTGTITSDGLDVVGGDVDAVSIKSDGSLQLYDPSSSNRAYTFLSRDIGSSMVGGNMRIDASVTTGSHIGYSSGTDARGGSGIVFENTAGGSSEYGDITFVQSNDTNDDTWVVREAMRIDSSGNVGIGKTNPATALDVDGTVTATSFAGDGSNLTGIAAGAGGGGSDEIFWENGQNVTTNYTITNGKNAMSAGPITIDSGVTVTVGAGETWAVV